MKSNIKVEIFKSKFMKGIMNQNTYVVSCNKNAIIIDAGAEVEDVKKSVGGKKVEAVLMTHLHFDHFWNLEMYLQEFDCDVFVCEGSEDKFADYEKNCSLMIRNKITKNISHKNVKYYKKELKFNNFDVEVWFTPGHSADCVCLKIGEYLFSGDTLFAGGVGRTDLCDSDEIALKNSLKLIKSIDYEILCPGHFEQSTKQNSNFVIDNFI